MFRFQIWSWKRLDSLRFRFRCGGESKRWLKQDKRFISASHIVPKISGMNGFGILWSQVLWFLLLTATPTPNIVFVYVVQHFLPLPLHSSSQDEVKGSRRAWSVPLRQQLVIASITSAPSHYVVIKLGHMAIPRCKGTWEISHLCHVPS